MAHSTRAASSFQVATFRRAFAQETGLPFADLLSAELVQACCPTATPAEPVYTPLVTLWMFLSQVCDADQSCAQAVARLRAWHLACGQTPASAATGGYCKARQRLGEDALQHLVQATGTRLHRQAPPAWLWCGRRVQIIDGTTVTLPDTPANQAAYPQPDGQRPGLGFPMIRLGVLLDLATGAVRDAALAPYRGKGTGELALLRQLWHHLEPGDVLLGDRIYCSYFEIALLQQRGIDVLLHKHQSRRSDFRTGTRLGRHDHLIRWRKPACPDWLDRAVWAALPAELEVREVAVTVRGRHRQRRRLVLVTTLTDPQAYPRETLGGGYRQRWHGEVDVRSIKQVMQMDQLRCQTPAMVRKELWLHMLAYNLIRGQMAAAAERHGLIPRDVSFKGALQTLRACSFGLLTGALAPTPATYESLLAAIASQRVRDRPDRVEPRAKKRRKKNYPLLTEPRQQARQRLEKQLT